MFQSVVKFDRLEVFAWIQEQSNSNLFMTFFMIYFFYGKVSFETHTLQQNLLLIFQYVLFHILMNTLCLRKVTFKWRIVFFCVV